MTTQTSVIDTSDIQELLQGTQEAHLADCLYLIPGHHICALNDMIALSRKNRVFKSRIQEMIISDIAAILEARPQNAIFSKPFLKTI